jgi:peptidoglycan/xylan/chitin deacetylase (PgdA/CDA1 family)
MRGTFFVTTNWVGHAGYVTWTQLREMHCAGMEIGSHTVNHLPMSRIASSQREHELRASKAEIEDHVGAEVVSFSFPGGYYDARSVSAARSVGYRIVAVSKPGLTRSTSDLVRRNVLYAGCRISQVDSLLYPRRASMLLLTAHYHMRIAARTALGVRRYVRLRNSVFGFFTRPSGGAGPKWS